MTDDMYFWGGAGTAEEIVWRLFIPPTVMQYVGGKKKEDRLRETRRCGGRRDANIEGGFMHHTADGICE